jgi:hypothetical protein
MMKRVASLLSIFAVAACGDSGTQDCTMPTSGAEQKYVVNSLLMPQQMPADQNFSFDLNGDKKPDNALLGLVTALKSQGLDVQAGVDDSVGLGNVILLIDETGMSLDNNACSKSVVTAGMPFGGGTCTAAAPTCATGKCYISASGNTTGCGPKFDGTETFVSAPATAQATFQGAITSGVFTSNNPATTKNPVSFALALPLIAGAPPVTLKISGARIAYTKSGMMAMKGQINGAVKKTDLDTDVIPAVAKLLDSRVRANPTNSTNQGILGLFDTGTGCTATDYNYNATDTDFDTSSPAMAGDGKIALCEVANNGLIKSLLKPDVQMFDANGNYAPSSANTTPDSLSIGIGFTGINATF